MALPNKFIVFLGRTFSGHNHDYNMLKQEFPPEVDWFADIHVGVDLGYQGIQSDYSGDQIDIPTAIPALSQRSYTTYAGGLSRSLFRLPEAVCDTPFKARSEARRNPLQRWVSIWIKLRHE
jgi:hypothetical protein